MAHLSFEAFLDHLKQLEYAQWAILIRKKTKGNLASVLQPGLDSGPSTPTVYDIQYRAQILPPIKKNDLLGAFYGAVNPSILEKGYRLESLDKDLVRDPEDIGFERTINDKMKETWNKIRRERVERMTRSMLVVLETSQRRQVRSDDEDENDENRNPNENPVEFEVNDVSMEEPEPPTPIIETGTLPSDAFFDLAYELIFELNTRRMTVECQKMKLKHFDYCYTLWIQHKMCETEINRGGNSETILEIFMSLRTASKNMKSNIYRRTPWTSDQERSEWLEDFLADTPPVEFETSAEAQEFWQTSYKEVMHKYFVHPKEAFFYELKLALSTMLNYCRLLVKEDNERGGSLTYEGFRNDMIRKYEEWDDIRNILLIPVEDPK